MFEEFKVHTESKKSSYIYQKLIKIKKLEENLSQADPQIKIFEKHRKLMEENKFDWIHESDIEKLNFNNIKSFLKNFELYFNRDTDKDFGLNYIFQKIFPLDLIFLYFKNINQSFGNKVYDESLRFKTQLLICFNDFYLDTDFVQNCKLIIDSEKFPFDNKIRNQIRYFNRIEILAKYETEKFSLKKFIFFLLDNYYPRVGWRWIGACHFVYFITLQIIVKLFELGFWKIDDLDSLLLKLYEISEVLVSLEKNSAKDSEHLAENFNKELINGFHTAREQMTLIIIHSYQLIVDQRVPCQQTENYKYFFIMIITRYIFNSTQIKNNSLRNKKNINQVLFYLNSNNFDYDPLPKKDFPLSQELETMSQSLLDINQSLNQIFDIIKSKDLEEEDHEQELFNLFFEAYKIFFRTDLKDQMTLSMILNSKILTKLVSLIGLMKNQYPDNIEIILDLNFCMINQLCVTYPDLFCSSYYKYFVKDYFEIEPFKNLYTISEIVIKHNIQMNQYFADFLGSIFSRNFKQMMKIFSPSTDEIFSSHEIFLGIIDLYISYFYSQSKLGNQTCFMELKMLLIQTIEDFFIPQLKQIFITDQLICYEDSYVEKSYEQISMLKTFDERLKGLRTKITYMILRLYNILINFTYKTQVLQINELKEILKIEEGQGSLIFNQIILLFGDVLIFAPNNVIINRLQYNKSNNFILMEQEFPFKEDQLSFVIDYFETIFANKITKNLNDDKKLNNYLFEASLPCLYKFLYGFVYLYDSNKNFEYSDNVQNIIINILKLFQKLNYINKKDMDCIQNKIFKEEIDCNTEIYKMLNQNENSYTNNCYIKKIITNFLYFLRNMYPKESKYLIEQYNRRQFVKKQVKYNFDENLKGILSKIDDISKIDNGESMKNMMLYFIEEFKNCQNTIKFKKFSEPNFFVFIKNQFYELICLLVQIFEKNIKFKKTFIELIVPENQVDLKEQFFTKFWIFYRDALFFSAYNFFHNDLWQEVSEKFCHMSNFLLKLTDDDLLSTNPILKYFFTFKIVGQFNNNHCLYFQLYVILECLGNYNKLLNLTEGIKLENKECIFFVIEKIFQVLSKILKHPEAQLKIYVYRIDIWMNLLLRNIADLNSSFYSLKYSLTQYFLTIAGGENPQIIKFFGANVNPEILKSSINKLFELLIRDQNLLQLVVQDPQKVDQTLKNNRIYIIIQNMYKFYNILLRYDVQCNYLHSFMEHQIQSFNQKTVTTEFLIQCNLVFFWYAYQVYTTFSFHDENGQFYSIKQIVDKKEKLKIHPILLELVRKQKIQLKDILNHNIQEEDQSLSQINSNLTIIQSIMKDPTNLTQDKQKLLKKVRENDFDWIIKNIFQSQNQIQQIIYHYLTLYLKEIFIYKKQ